MHSQDCSHGEPSQQGTDGDRAQARVREQETFHLCDLVEKYMIAKDKNVHKGFGRSPLTKSSTNFLRRLAAEVRLSASLNNSHVHPSLIGANFFGMRMNAFDNAFIGMGTKGNLKADGGPGTCVCEDHLPRQIG